MPAVPADSSPRSAPFGRHIMETLRLAVPVMLARVGLVAMVVVDTLMCGQAGPEALASYGISLAPQATLMVAGFGLLMGTGVLVAQADGAGRAELCGRIWRHSLMIAGALGAAFALVFLAGEAILEALGQEPAIAAGGGATLTMFGPGMPAILMYVATIAFLEGIRRPRAGMAVALAANVLNAALNWLLIYGHLGLPAMGAPGASLATSIARWAMLAALVGYVLLMPDGARYGVRAPLAGHYAQARKLLRLGLPLALATGLETTAFAATTVFAGWLGRDALAAYQVATNVMVLIFMLAIGVSTATAVKVGNAVGRGDQAGVARAGWTGAGLILVLMLGAGVIVFLARRPIAQLYGDDPAVISAAAAALAIVAGMVILDGMQGVLMGAVRGAADVLVPTAMQGVAFWAVSVPAAYWLAIGWGGGIPGLLSGLLLGLIAASLMLGWRFHAISRRAIAPV